MTFRRAVLSLSFLFLVRAKAEQSVIGDLVRIRPTTTPVVCNNGDLRVASNDSNKLKICRGNSWSIFAETDTTLTNPMTTLGDLIVGGASGTPARLGVGSANTLLKSSGTTAAWGLVTGSNIDTASSVVVSTMSVTGATLLNTVNATGSATLNNITATGSVTLGSWLSVAGNVTVGDLTFETTGIVHSAGTLDLRSATAAGTSGFVSLYSGPSTTSDSGEIAINSGTAAGTSGNIRLTSGNGTSGSGEIALITGVTGGTRGKIRFVEGTQGTANRVWKSSDTSGNGNWSQVAFSELTGTASIAQGGTNNGTLAVTAGGMFYSDGTRFMNMGAGSSGNAIRSGGTGTPAWRAIIPTIQRFTSGSGTYTTPTNVLWIRVRLCGGGAGGTGSGSSGGTAATAGGNSTFGTSLLTANGGGAGSSLDVGGLGGSVTVSSPAVAVATQSGSSGASGGAANSAGFRFPGGIGGNCPGFYGGGGGAIYNANGSAAMTNSGGGGQGGGNNAATNVISGGGGGGGGYIDAIISAPSSTYSYSVGTAGAAGAAGTSGLLGGAGAAGIIIVEEFY